MCYSHDIFSSTVDFRNIFYILQKINILNNSINHGWKNLNQAVSNYVSQNLKQSLAQAGLFAGQDMTAPYQQGLPDAYSRYVPDLAFNKKLQDNVEKVTGVKAKGSDVAKKLKMATRERMLNNWLKK